MERKRLFCKGMRTYHQQQTAQAPEVLEVLHLNGTLDDLPDHVTFSVTQFADRLSKPDPSYMGFVIDLLSHPIIIIGTRLDEPVLCQNSALSK